MLRSRLTPHTRHYIFEVNPVRGTGLVKGMGTGHAYRMQHYDPIVQGGDFIRGMGECCWATDGMVPFALAAREFRLKDWAHFAPWSWLNFWPNFLEGMSHDRHPWKYNNHPDRSDGVDGWGSPVVSYVHQSLHPYLVLSHEGLSAGYVTSSNVAAMGLPVYLPREHADFMPAMETTANRFSEYLPGERVEKDLEVFNGGLFGSQMQLHWSAHWDHVDGPVIEHGETIGPFTIEPGFHATKTIAFTAPALESEEAERRICLKLASIKNGKVVFREDGIALKVVRHKWVWVDDAMRTWLTRPAGRRGKAIHRIGGLSTTATRPALQAHSRLPAPKPSSMVAGARTWASPRFLSMRKTPRRSICIICRGSTRKSPRQQSCRQGNIALNCA